MGPTNEALTCANVPSKELSWIDQMYRKLENMCVEVDKNPSLLIQETSKYVESQMNVVGTNVKKLCVELIQDLLPPPILSSEGADKKLECAIHCKCDCVDSEKSKPKSANKTGKTNEGGNTRAGMEDIQAKEVNTGLSEFKEESGIFGNVEPPKKVPGAMKVEERKIEVATQQQETSIEADFEGPASKSKVNAEEHNNTIVQGEEKKIEVAVQPNETGKGADFKEQVNRSKESGRQSEMSREEHSYNCGQVEVHNGNTEEKKGVIDVEDKTTEVAVQQWVCARKAEFEGHTGRSKEGEDKELGIIYGQMEAHKVNVVQGVTEVEERSIEAEMQQQESEAANRLKDSAKSSMDVHASDCDTQQSVKDTESAIIEAEMQQQESEAANRLKDSAKSSMDVHASDCDTQQSVKDTELALHEEMDDDAKSMYSSVFSIEDTEVAIGKERDEVGGDPKSIYSYVLSELSHSSKVVDSMMMSGYLIEEEYEDEEQSARWFVSEGHGNIFQVENLFPSSFEESPQTRCHVEESDSDWELL